MLKKLIRVEILKKKMDTEEIHPLQNSTQLLPNSKGR